MSDYLVSLSILGQIDWHAYKLKTNLSYIEVKQIFQACRVSYVVFRFLWRYIFWHAQWDHNRQDGWQDNIQRFIWRVALRAQTTHRKKMIEDLKIKCLESYGKTWGKVKCLESPG